MSERILGEWERVCDPHIYARSPLGIHIFVPMPLLLLFPTSGIRFARTEA